MYISDQLFRNIVIDIFVLTICMLLCDYYIVL